MLAMLMLSRKSSQIIIWWKVLGSYINVISYLSSYLTPNSSEKVPLLSHSVTRGDVLSLLLLANSVSIQSISSVLQVCSNMQKSHYRWPTFIYYCTPCSIARLFCCSGTMHKEPPCILPRSGLNAWGVTKRLTTTMWQLSRLL